MVLGRVTFLLLPFFLVSLVCGISKSCDMGIRYNGAGEVNQQFTKLIDDEATKVAADKDYEVNHKTAERALWDLSKHLTAGKLVPEALLRVASPWVMAERAVPKTVPEEERDERVEALGELIRGMQSAKDLLPLRLLVQPPWKITSK